MPESDYPQAPGLSDIVEEGEEHNDLDKVIKTLLNPDNIHHLTDLTGQESMAFSTLYSFCPIIDEHYPDQTIPLKEWLAYNLKLRVSKGRAGRKEFVKISQRANEYPEHHQRSGFDFFRR